MASGQLRSEMSRSQFETWVQPLKPLGYTDRVYRLAAVNAYAREWVEARLRNRITALLSGMFNEPVTLRLVVGNGFDDQDQIDSRNTGSAAPEPLARNQSSPETGTEGEGGDAPDLLDNGSTSENGKASPRKLMLYRAYGSERARVIQPERGMFITLYFFQQWLPLIGHSAFTVILAARSMCYWNPKTGELRNSIETDMGELARRASVSVRTVKDVLNNELVRRYFLRYTVRRVMTPYGVRTAGILLQVRMDDPLTPEDQAENGLSEDSVWYSPEFEDESEP